MWQVVNWLLKLLAFLGIAGAAVTVGPNVVVEAVSFIFRIFTKAALLLLNIAISIFDAVISQSFNTDLFNQPFLFNAWTQIKDFANIFIVFFLIIIALATVLDIGIGGISSYNAKKLLPRLIFIALAVNFSFVITKFLIDIFNSPMFFLSRSSFLIGGQYKGFGEGLKYLLDISNLGTFSQATLKELSGITNTAQAIENAASSIIRFFTILILGIALLILSVGLYVRIVIFWFLMIMAPMAWIIAIMPWFRSAWNMWWSQLFGWGTYGIVAMFWLYIAGIIILGIDIQEALAVKFKGVEFAFSGGVEGFFSNFFSLAKYLVILVAVFAALKSARPAATLLGGAVVGAVGGYIYGRAKAVGRWGLRQAGRPVRAARLRAREEAQRIGGRLQERIGERLSRTRILRGTGRAMQVAGRKRQQEAIKRTREIMSHLTDEELLQEIQNPTLTRFPWAREDVRRELMEEALRRNTFRRIPPEQVGLSEQTIRNLYEDLRQRGRLEQAEKLRAQNARIFFEHEYRTWQAAGAPTAGPQYDEFINRTRGIISEMLRQGEEKNLRAEDLRNVEFLRALSDKERGGMEEDRFIKFAEELDPERRRAIEETLEREFLGRVHPQTGLYEDQERRVREMYARITGDLGRAFLHIAPGGQRVPRDQAIRSARHYVISMREKDFDNLRETPDTFDILANNFSTRNISNAKDISDDAKRAIVNRIRQLIPTLPPQERARMQRILQKMADNDYWIDVV